MTNKKKDTIPLDPIAMAKMEFIANKKGESRASLVRQAIR